jgi:hypothetical protein
LPEVEAATNWLWWIHWAKIVGAFLVAIGVAAEFLGDFVAKPYEDILEAARKSELGELHKQAEDAKLETARLSVASDSARAGVAAAQEETAKANKATEALRRENLEIREKVAARRITKEQHDILYAELSKTPGVFTIQALHEGESALYASDILKALTNARWTVDKQEFPLGDVWTGLIIFQTDDPAAFRIAEAFKAASIPFLVGDAQHKKDKATIMVGAKPPPF